MRRLTICIAAATFLIFAVAASAANYETAWPYSKGSAIVFAYDQGGEARETALIYVTGMTRGLGMRFRNRLFCLPEDHPKFISRKVIYTIGASDALRRFSSERAILMALINLWGCDR